ncbi:MAG: hypothetical protein KatS3mg126_2321 [Lysobacteraceae bacterium]|nr:MAG: hypothetical protein KatS3mg126_2321 [Xanthomonadaceae bacterium]
MHRISVLLLLLAGCAAQPRDATPEAPRQAAMAAIEVWEQAWDRWREEGSEEASAALAAAADELAARVAACAAVPGCPTPEMLDRQARALAAQTGWLLREGPGQGDQALAAEGEGGGLQAVEAAPLPEGVRSAVNQLDGRDLRELIELNPAVQAALNEWLTWMRPQLLEAYENYRILRPQMWPEYAAAGLPEALLFGILAKESAGKVHAVSRAGAAGPLQFMPATAARLGLGRDADGFDQRFDPRLAARANVRYLNERFAEFGHDLALALAAYNGGEGRVGRLVRRGGAARFWDPAIQRELPAETRDYVPMVLAAAWLFLHPDEYGLIFPEVQEGAVRMRLVEPASLNQLAICAGQQGSRSGWFRALRNLNPRYMPDTVLPAGTELEVPETVAQAYPQSCLSGELAERARWVASAAKRHELPSGPSHYVVRRGDTLAAIARRNGCPSAAHLARANGIRPPEYLIRPGQKLRLMDCRG